MPALALPPWLEAARPADYMAKGMGIGAELAGQRAAADRAQQAAAERAQEFQQQMGAEQAAQQFKMQQAARQSQLAAQEQARADVETQLKASQMADRSKAILNYQSAIAGGMDPLKAVLQFGPAMGGQASPEAAALRSQATQNLPAPAFVPANAETGEPAHYVESTPGGAKRIAFPPRAQSAAEAPQFVPESPDTGPAHWVSGNRITQARAAQSLSASDREALRANRKILTDFAKAAGDPIMSRVMQKADPKAYEESQNEARDAAKAILEIQPDDPMAKRFAGGSKGASKSKVDRAKEISAEHPDWTKAQVIKAVNDEFK